MTDDAPLWADLLARLQAGDTAARPRLLDLAHARLRRLAATMLHGSFPALRHRHEVDSVVHEGCLRLLKAFEAGVAPPTPADFFRFAAFKVRAVLLDMADGQAKHATRFTADADIDPSHDTYDPAALAAWREFHDRADALAEPDRTVFGLRHYLGMSQREIAQALAMHPKAVSRAWLSATERLADSLPGGDGPTA